MSNDLSIVKFARVKKNNGTDERYSEGKVFNVQNLKKQNSVNLFSFYTDELNIFQIFKNDSYLDNGEWEFLDDKLNVIDAQELYDGTLNNEEVKYESAPFDLEKALAGDPVWTRYEENVTELHLFKVGDEERYPLHAVIAGERVESFTKEGFEYDSDSESENDLFMKVAVKKKVKKSGYVLLNELNNTWGCIFSTGSNVYKTKDNVIKACENVVIDEKNIKLIEWEE